MSFDVLVSSSRSKLSLNALNTRSLTVIGYASAIMGFLVWNAVGRVDRHFAPEALAKTDACSTTASAFGSPLWPETRAGFDRVTTEPAPMTIALELGLIHDRRSGLEPV